MKQFNYIVYIGRMQPPTKAHIANIKTALELANHVIILLGSSNQPRTIKNPWNVAERSAMILNQIPPIDADRLRIDSIIDYRYNDQEWVQQIQHKVKKYTCGMEPKIGIIGCKKDSTSYYLDYFPQWDFIDIDPIDDINASTVREDYFNKTLFQWKDKELISPELANYLKRWCASEAYQQLVREFTFINDYKKGWANSPYPPTFTTVDCVVIQSGHVLLIKRKASPGEGLFALPGGFINQDETLLDAAIRELREETKLKIPTPVLKGCLKNEKVFDKPDRSLRGRTITYAFTFLLPAGQLSKVKGGDDASSAKWIPIDDALNMEEFLFEDHIDIIRNGINNV